MNLDGAAHSPLFTTELARAIAKHPQEKWAQMGSSQMFLVLLGEVKELSDAMLAEDINGDHGAIREATHVQVVAQRIIDEMERRNGRQR